MKNFTVISDYGILNKSIIDEFENSKNIKLPEQYKEIVSKYNGLCFIESWFDYLDDDKKEEASFSFLTYGDFVGASIISKEQDYDTYGFENIVAFGAVGNGDSVIFDYRQNPETYNPPVAIMYHDEYIKDENGNTKMKIIKIADNFDEFLNMLHE